MIRIEDRLLERAFVEAAGARLVRDLALSPRASLAVCFNDAAEWLQLFFAIRQAGGSVLPLHPSTPHAAARRLAEAAGCDTLLFKDAPPEALAAAPPRTEGCLIQMSSGTTGAPKVVARSWADIDAEVESYVGAFREPESMTPVVACPTTHSYGLICGLLVALRRGQVPVILDPGNPKHLKKRLSEIERPLLYSSPAVLHTLARLLPAGETLHATMTSGTILPEAWFTAIRATSQHMFQQYGCSEVGCIAVNPDVTAPTDMGRPLPHHALSAGTGPDDPAEIVVSGPYGRVPTADLGYIGQGGMLVFVARMDDTINVSGLNVYPGEVEDVVMAMPGVLDAVAFRKPDRFAGERVGLVFSAEAPLAARALRDWCAGRLAPHQVPSEILQVAQVPRQANGKVNRRELAALHAAGALGLSAEAS